MTRVLVTYSSTHGQTEKIARRMASAVEDCGLDCELLPVKDDPDPAEFEGVLAGASIHVGHHQREMADWVKRHARDLTARPGGFFSVSLTAAEETAEERRPAKELLEEFLEDAGWDPQLRAAVAGALRYREYNPFTRMAMRRMMRRGGHPTDSSRDYEYTDWRSVDEFARSLAALAAEDSELSATRRC
jgi:menaquinone-dependent protoporphyrinogen oxidase